MRSARQPWLTLVGSALLIVGMATFFINAEALMNGDAVECDGRPMRPGQWCARVGDESRSYEEEKKNEASGELIGYAGMGLGTLGVVVLVSNAIAVRRGNQRR
jgi:hypothetical protein